MDGVILLEQRAGEREQVNREQEQVSREQVSEGTSEHEQVSKRR